MVNDPAGQAPVGGVDVAGRHAVARVDHRQRVAIGPAHAVDLDGRVGGEDTRAFSMSSASRWARSAAAGATAAFGSMWRTTRWKS